MTLLERFNSYAWVGVLKHLIANNFFTTANNGNAAITAITPGSTGTGVAGSIYDGDKTVTTATQREAIATGVPSVWIKNTGSNLMRFRFGDSAVVATIATGFELAAGESDSYPIADSHTNWAYIAATGGTTAAVVWGG